MKRVVIAPDSFKGTLSSREVCDIISAAVRKNYPDAVIRCIPVADGGEGTAEAIQYALGGERVYCKVSSPLGRELDGYFLDIGSGTAVVESAVASGLTTEKVPDALRASSYGTGQLIKAAVNGGAEKIIVGIGGSAMTDGGAGCLAALGVRFYGENGEEIVPCGANLCDIRRVDLSDFDGRITDAEITLLCDVKNPLYGENGAAYIFAPQKGATKKDTELLDAGLRNFSHLCKELLGEDYSYREGAGAAGGLGFAMMAFMKAKPVSGIDCVLDLCNFEKEAENADLIITGEGKLDSQSLSGKVPFGVAARCKGKRVIAVAGVSEIEEDTAYASGISGIIETNPLHLPFEEIKHRAKDMLSEAAKKIKL